MTNEHEGRPETAINSHPGASHQQSRENLKEFNRLTEEGKERLRQRLEQLKADREESMHAASTHAGKLGFVYRAETNDYIRMVSGAEVPVAPPRPIAPPVPAAPQPPQVKPLGARSKSWWSKTMDALHWLLAVPVGAFIGYGLGKLAGLITAREPYWFWLAIVLGVSLIVGLKLLLGKLWYGFGHKKSMERLKWYDVPLGLFATFTLIGLEAWLGGQALALYSRQNAMNSGEVLSFFVAFPMAIAISVGILLYSAVKGYQDGQAGLSEAELEERAHQRAEKIHRAEAERIDRQHQADLAAWSEEKQRHEAANEAAKRQFEAEKEEFDSVRKLPEYQALLGYVGRVSTLNILIEETKQDLDNYSISRGHGQKSVL
ncbi:MAG: cell envelope integrity protein TolA [Fimbriimonadaceae bacterium]|nr:cell envelope integrity protein TolA [Fimbriimonadaceae bacterium]QYK57191.1 MAG: cell envelope integrity protein TolA [Fimbriimonadaceae bacterium]